jgi:hypothetical protein
VRRGGLWTKHIGLNQGAIGNTLGAHIGNKGKMKKNPPPEISNPQNLKEKKSRHLECMLQPTHWLHVFLIV